MHKIDLHKLKKAIESARKREGNKEARLSMEREQEHCKGCTAYHYFWLLDRDGRGELWESASELKTKFACTAVWKLIDVKYGTHIYNRATFEDLKDEDEGYEEPRNFCLYPNPKKVESLISIRKTIHI
jgi:hypothetical protein